MGAVECCMDRANSAEPYLLDDEMAREPRLPTLLTNLRFHRSQQKLALPVDQPPEKWVLVEGQRRKNVGILFDGGNVRSGSLYS